MDLGVYAEAVVHLAWFRNGGTCHLLFAMAELRPAEFPPSRPCLRRDFRARGVGRKRNQHLHYQRFTVPVSAAIDWVRRTAGGNVAIPHADATPLVAGPFLEEPPWPHFVSPDATTGLPFAPDWLRASQAHFLFPTDPIDHAVRNAIDVDANSKQLLDWLNFDLAHRYADYLGAVCLLAPNPFFRSVEHALQDAGPESPGETVAYKLVARHGQDLAGIRLEVVNERLRGRMLPVAHDFDGDAIAEIHHPASVYKEGLSITHPQHGLLHWHAPSIVVRRIRLGTEIVAQEKHVQVPTRGRKRPAYTHEVLDFEHAGDVVVGDAMDDDGVLARLVGAELQRKRQEAARAYDQQWFHRAPADAAAWVRQTIGTAREAVLIVDPYFAGRELFAFGHAVRRPAVTVRILTSVLAFGNKAKRKTAARGLAADLAATFANHAGCPEVRVMTGKSPAIHDRLLAVDHQVWLSGNSLNMIGERASVVVKLPDPAAVLSHVEAIWIGAQDLSDWLAASQSGGSGS